MRADLPRTRPARGSDGKPAANPAAVGAWLLVALVAGCGGTGPAPDDRSAPSQNAAPAAVPSEPPAVGEAHTRIEVPAAAAVADLPSPTIGASGADVSNRGSEPPILSAVRVGQHPGVDRLVFEFDGVGLPAWHVEYVDRPVRDCGSGDAVPVAGDAWLQIRFNGAHAHTPAGVGTSGPRRRAVSQPVLRELVRTCDFEAEVTWVAGLTRPKPYTPRVLAGPARLVIDIAH